MTETEDAAPAAAGTTAVELARLSGQLQQFMIGVERRLYTLESNGDRWAGRWSPILAGVALVVALAEKVPWR
jgi:hypothetical protein